MKSMNSKAFKKRVFDVIQIGNKSDTLSRSFDYFIAATIILNILVMFLETFDEFAALHPLFRGIEIATILIFCVEYALRIWTASYLYPDGSRKEAVMHFLLSYDGLVDLLTILPFFWMDGFVAFRMMRVVRIFHLFRINASADSFTVIRSVLYEKLNQIASSMFIVFVLMLASSLCMYGVEHQAQPEVFRNVFSGIWWSVSALLTVGYGDIYPITTVGRILAIIMSFLGVMAVAIPTGIISAGFVEQYSRAQASDGSFDMDLQTVVVDLDSAWLGLGRQEILEKYNVTVLLVERGSGEPFPPSEEWNASLKDKLAIYRRGQE